MNTLGPLTLQPRLVERIWGETKLHNWYSQPQPNNPVGEVWLTAEECIAEGSEQTLKELTEANPSALANEDGTGFPLLIKLLYPREKLSVQVHPNDQQALATLGQPRGKTECWYVLSAEPGAEVAVGFKNPLTPEAIRDAITAGTLESELRYIPVSAGDMVFVDAGTVHAIGPGMVVLETQQYSDVTYRLYDYGRPRELHLDAGLAVARTSTAAGLVPSRKGDNFTRLIEAPYFTVDSFKSDAAGEYDLGNSNQMQILIALNEGASIKWNGSALPLQPGSAVVLPKEDTSYHLQTAPHAEVVRVLGKQA